MSGWTDAHCHLQDNFIEAPVEEKEQQLLDTLQRALDADVDRVIVIGTGADTSAGALEVADIDAPVEIYATVGLHPHDSLSPLGPIETLARSKHPKLVGIGECGLDYYYEHSPRDQQRRIFAEQIGLAHELDLALVIHARDAFDDLMDIFASEGVPSRTVIHCFTGVPDDAERCLSVGCDISISGIVTFKNADSLRDAAKIVPIDRLHVETDSPFLAPAPHRGKPNEPAFVSIVGQYVAELRGEDPEELKMATSSNTTRLFALPAQKI